MESLGNKAVGDIVTYDVGYWRKDFFVVHQGLPTGYDSSCDGTWLMMVDAYTSIEYYRSTYLGSEVHYYANNDFFYDLPSELQEQIKEVTLSSSYEDGIVTKVFAPSSGEIGAYEYEGPATLDFFNGYGLDKIAFYNGSAVNWYTREFDYDMDENLVIRTNGVGFWDYMHDTEVYFRPMFILPSETSVINGHIIIDGASKEISKAHANIGGAWKEISEAYTNVNGVWKPMN